MSGLFLLNGPQIKAAPIHPSADTNIIMKKQYMRIARIVVDSSHLSEYYSALRQGMETAIREEPGVLNLWAVAEEENPTHITVFEIYADKEAYKAHIQTEHFRRYKTTVEKWVLSLVLVDVDPIALKSKGSQP